MNNKQHKNKFHFTSNYGLFLGTIENNIPHKHYAMQISISFAKTLTLSIQNTSISTYACFIDSNQTHTLASASPQLTLLINPISRIGHYLRLKQVCINSIDLNNNIAKALHNIFHKYYNDNDSFSALCNAIDDLFKQFICDCENEYHTEDDRIYTSISYLDKHFDRIVSLKEIAAVCFLSESRFLHLFKEKTHLNFRRYQLWNKVVKSLPLLKQNGITATAHQFGFSDSSHYTRTFKETFGVTPKFLLPKE